MEDSAHGRPAPQTTSDPPGIPARAAAAHVEARNDEREKKQGEKKQGEREAKHEAKQTQREAEREAKRAEREAEQQKKQARREQKRAQREAEQQKKRAEREQKRAQRAEERRAARDKRRRERDEGSPTLRLRILDGASEAFGAQGFANCHVRDILHAAGVSRPTFYKFFSNKEEAFNALSETMTMSLVQMVRSVVSTCSDPREMLERGIDAYLRWRASAGHFGRVLLSESKKPDTFAAAQRRAAVDAITTLFAGQVASKVEKPPDPLLYVGLIAALESMADAVLSDASGEKEIERCKAVMFELVENTLGQYIPEA